MLHDFWINNEVQCCRLVSLGRFIATYGTHIIVGMAVGGQDVICVKQKHSSKVSPGYLRRHLEI